MRAAALARCLTAVGSAIVMVGLGACATSVEGSAVKESEPASTVNADGVNVDRLQPGNYPTKRRPAPAPSQQNGIRVDAQRMADHVVLPWDVDESLTEPVVLGIGVLDDPKTVVAVLPVPVIDVVRAHGFLYGFSSTRADRTSGQQTKSLLNAVLRFPTDADARAVAEAVHEQSPAQLENAEALPMPGHPEALATRSTFMNKARITSVTPHGPFLLVQEAQSEDAEAAVQMVGKALDLQAPAIDEFSPTPVDELPALDTDPTGLFSRTVMVGDPKLPIFGVYGEHGILHFRSPKEAAWYDAAGVDAASLGPSTFVYQTRDGAAATDLAAQIAGGLSDGAKPAGAVPGMPAAKCFFSPDSPVALMRYNCVAPAGRWVITAGSQQERDAAQLITAQYLMLTGKQ